MLLQKMKAVHQPVRSSLTVLFSRQFSRSNAMHSGGAASSTVSALPSMPNIQHLKRFYKHATVVPHPDSDKLEKLRDTEDVTFENLSMSHD